VVPYPIDASRASPAVDRGATPVSNRRFSLNALALAALSALAFAVAYRTYGGWLRRTVLRLEDDEPVPAHQLTDGVDYVPSRRSMLFGHHFASIAGLGPILGPAIAVIWGWLPAVLWIVFGTIFVGGVHDFTTLVLSMRNRGRSIGDVANDILGRRARILFLVIIFFLMSLAMGVFVLVIATLFTAAPADGTLHPESHPEAVMPVVILLVAAVGMGVALYKAKWSFLWVTVLGVGISFAGLVWGAEHPVTSVARGEWIWILLAYAFLASILPVWLLLQPRDYLNSFQLYAGMGLMFAGLLVSHPDVVAPAINTAPTDLPPIFPFLFITVACGAISGFHCLVSSGTTAKQINCARDAQSIGYGAMVTEGMLAILAVLACTAGIGTLDEWNLHYASWALADGGLGPKIGAFVTGAGRFMHAVGLPLAGSTAFAAVVVVSFALTTLDSATRLLRYNIEELGGALRVPLLANRYVASLAAVFSIAGFAFLKIGGKPAGIVLWELFGTTNQLLGGLALLTVTVWLAKLKRPTRPVLIPMAFLFLMTLLAMLTKIRDFWAQEAWAVFAFGVLLLVLAIWLVTEGLVCLWRISRPGTPRAALERG
jgi:carbon starvation protein